MSISPIISVRFVRSWLQVWLLLLLLVSCRRTPAVQSILPGHIHLEVGDVVFRQGNGLTSRAVRAADADGRYSHIGMVVKADSVLQIVHAVPGEPDYPGDPDRVKMELPEKFFHPVNASCGRVMRPRNARAAREAAQKACEVYARGTLFDHTYNDRDTTTMYCCELIAHCFRAAHYPLIGSERHHYHLPGLDLDHLVLPSDFLRSESLVTVAEF